MLLPGKFGLLVFRTILFVLNVFKDIRIVPVDALQVSCTLTADVRVRGAVRLREATLRR